MDKKILKLFNELIDRLGGEDKSVQKAVKYSLEKYKNTYKWLEEYDQKAVKNPDALAGSTHLRPYLRDIQKKSGV